MLPEVYDITGNHKDQYGWSLEKATDMKLVCQYSWIFPEVYTDNRDGVYG